MAEALPSTVRDSVDLLLPVPVSQPRMRSRGYNQAELLARKVAELSGIEMKTGLLVRTGAQPAQARSSSIGERSENVRNVFEATEVVTGNRILLIDDVMTTGSTLNACAIALQEAGADWVGALVLAREL